MTLKRRTWNKRIRVGINVQRVTSRSTHQKIKQCNKVNFCEVENFILFISYVDVLSVNIIDKKILSISNIENLSIPDIDMNVLSIPHEDKLS